MECSNMNLNVTQYRLCNKPSSHTKKKEMFKMILIRTFVPVSVPPTLWYITGQKTVTISYSFFKIEAFCNITLRDLTL